MIKRSLLLVLSITIFISILETKLFAAETSAQSSKQVSESTSSVIDKNNQMMLVFVERLKSGNVKEARKIAQDMVDFSKKYTDSATIEYKSFYSKIEKELYSLKYKDPKKKVVWVEEPIADGYYFLAVIDFQEKHFKDAINNIQKCISWNPVHAPYYCERGFIFLNSGPDANIINAQVAYEQALEVANNEDDFASALRGLSFVLAARNKYVDSAAAMILSKSFDSNSIEPDAHILNLKKLIPNYNFDISPQKAVQILRDSKIQTTYSPEHTKVLLKMANDFKIPEQKKDAVIYLKAALLLEPQNKEVLNKLKELEK